jgi:hypothetical protein
MYFGSAPLGGAGAVAPAEGALQALKTLRSVTRGGVARWDYGPRLSDAKIQVDKLSVAGGRSRFRAYAGEVGRGKGGFYGWSQDGSKAEAIGDEGAFRQSGRVDRKRSTNRIDLCGVLGLRDLDEE